MPRAPVIAYCLATSGFSNNACMCWATSACRAAQGAVEGTSAWRRSACVLSKSVTSYSVESVLVSSARTGAMGLVPDRRP